METTTLLNNMRDSIELAAREIIEWNTGKTLDELHDAIAEQSDSLVDVYYRGCALEWVAAGMPTLEDEGMESSGDIHKDIAAAMCYWYAAELRDVLARLLGE